MADPDMPHRGSAPPNDGMSAVRVVFPQDEADFESDVRVSFDKLNDKWVLEDDNGKEYEWVANIRKWIESVRFHHPTTSMPSALCVSSCA